MQTALIAFDSKQLTLILSKMLEDFGFVSVFANTPEQIKPMIEENNPAVLFRDWTLAGKNIGDIVKDIRQKTTVIFVSKEKEPTQIAQALDLGAAEYIMKPFDNDILQSKLAMAGLL